VSKTRLVYVNFLRDVAIQKLLKSANVSWSYSQNNSGTVILRHCVCLANLSNILYVHKTY